MASAVTFKPSVKASLLKSINKRNAELSFSVTPRTKPTASKFKKAGVLITKAEVEIVTTSKGLDRSGINEVTEKSIVFSLSCFKFRMSLLCCFPFKRFCNYYCVFQGGRWLNCTTRHIRIYVGAIDPISRKIDQSQIDKLTLMVDPDNEFLWPDETLKRVYDEFGALIDQYEVLSFPLYLSVYFSL